MRATLLLRSLACAAILSGGGTGVEAQSSSDGVNLDDIETMCAIRLPTHSYYVRLTTPRAARAALPLAVRCCRSTCPPHLRLRPVGFNSG